MIFCCHCMLYVISWYIGPCYNGIQLYFLSENFRILIKVCEKLKKDNKKLSPVGISTETYACLPGYEQIHPFISSLNTWRPRQNGRHFADTIFKSILLNEDPRISTKISLKFVPQGPINNIPALVQRMASCRPGRKPLSELMMEYCYRIIDFLQHEYEIPDNIPSLHHQLLHTTFLDNTNNCKVLKVNMFTSVTPLPIYWNVPQKSQSARHL